MNEIEKEDLIKGISLCLQHNYFAIKSNDLYQKFKEVNEYDLKTAIDTMLRRKQLIYDLNENKYRLVMK